MSSSTFKARTRWALNCSVCSTSQSFKSTGCSEISTVPHCKVVLQQALWERWPLSSCSNILSISRSLFSFLKLCETYLKVSPVDGNVSESHFSRSDTPLLSLQQPLSLDQDCSVLRDQQVSLELRVTFAWVNCATSFICFFFFFLSLSPEQAFTPPSPLQHATSHHIRGKSLY